MQLQPTKTGTLDATRAINELPEEEFMEFIAQYPRIKKFVCRGWEEKMISDHVMRCISFTMGEQMEELDLSYSGISSTQLEILLCRVKKLRVCSFTGCPNLNGTCMNVLARFCDVTLTELYVNKCPLFELEPLLWMSGSTGFQQPSLKKLVSLDLSDCPLQPEGLLAAAKCCKNIQFLNIQNCEMVTDKALSAFMKATSKKLRLVNLQGLKKLTTKGVIAVADNCPELVSINLARCELITNKGIERLSSKCRNLQAVNLTGLDKLDERPLCVLTNNCPGLLMLNVTGITDVTVRGLEALIEGIDAVQSATSFVGFRPVDNAVETKLQGHLDMLQETFINHVKKEKKQERIKRELREKMLSEKVTASANTIKRYMFAYKLRQGFYRMWQARRRLVASGEIQRVWRGIMGRVYFNEKMREWKLFLSNTPYAIKMQKCIRGHRVRVHNPLVPQAMRDLYVSRGREAEAWISVRFQANARRFLAKKRTEAWREYCSRRALDEFNAILILQMLARRYNAKTLLFQKRFEKIRREKLEYTASTKLQKWYIRSMNRYLSKLSGAALQKAMNRTWRMTQLLQRSYRGFKGRERFNKMRIQTAVENYAAIKIQKQFRCARVLHWKDMRLNVIAAYALDRHYIERRESVAASRLRYKAYVTENRRDSASNSDDPVDADADAIWIRHFDYKKNRPYWVNEGDKTVSFDEPPKLFNKELSMVNMRVRVFWPVAGLWYEGAITDFHKRKKRHCIEYDDGDREWINLEENQERVQVQLNDGSWIMVLMFKPPGEQEELAKKEKKADEEAFKKQAFADADQWQIIQDALDDDVALMFMSKKTGEIRAGSIDAKSWVVHHDEFGYPCFFNIENNDVVYEDPRFIHDTDKDLNAQRDYIMQEMRYALYFCKDYWDRYMAAQGLGSNSVLEHVDMDEHGNPIEGTEVYNVDESKIDEREQHKILLQVMNSDKPKHLASFLVRAKAYYRKVSSIDVPLNEDERKDIELGQFISERMSEMRDKADAVTKANRTHKYYHVNKLEMKHSSKFGKQYFCVKCGEEMKRHEEFCALCGKRQIIM
eukprot:GSChrysophyteH1.ASY1.ANO1.858.1 assembled CDS